MHVMYIPSWYNNDRNKVHGSFFKEQALALQDAGINITVAYNEIWPLTLIGKIKEKSGMYFNEEDGLKTYRYKNYNFVPKHPLMFKVFNKRMDMLYNEILKKEGKVDLIHCQSSFWAGISAAYISKKYNVPLVITEHSSLKRAIYIKESYKPHIRKSYILADALIAVGNGLKKEIQEFTGRQDIDVIHNLIPIDNFYINNTINEQFTFFSLAFLEGDKGMDILIKAFAKGFKDIESKLIIGGEGSQKEYLINLAKSQGVFDKVEFLGALSREDVAKYMSKCDVFALASKHETFGVVYIEALASGKPVIGTFNGGAEDIINLENGIIVKNDDVDALMEGMLYIKENRNKYNDVDIRKKCSLKYSKEKISSQIISVYNDLVK